MVAISYVGLGDRPAAIRRFDALRRYVEEMRALQALCEPNKADHLAFEVALDGLETTAFHFTRRPYYYEDLTPEIDRHRTDHPGLADVVAAFGRLGAYRDALRALQGACRPFGRDYQAISIAISCFDTLAFHFTRDPAFYAAGWCGQSDPPAGRG